MRRLYSSSVKYLLFKNAFIFVHFFRKKQDNRLSQEAGTLTCTHCSFRTSYRQSLINHEKCHSANHRFKCSFCTFSSKTEYNLVVQHINRVHLEELEVMSLLFNIHYSHLLLLFTCVIILIR